MQIAQREPAVRHALVAVGALNERRDLYVKDVTYSKTVVTTSSHSIEASIPDQREQHNDPFALSQYNKAIAHLAKAMNSSSSNSVDTALLVCILFVCVECLRGDYVPALKHFQGGMSIAIAAAGEGGPNSRASQTTGVREKVVPFFNRLELLGQVYGHRPAYEYGLRPSDVLPHTFHSIVEARDSIVHIMNLSIRLIHKTKFDRYNGKVTQDDYTYHGEIVKCVLACKTTLDHFLLTVPPSPRLTEAATILEIQQIVCLTWLNRSLVPEECVADADIPLYERAVSLAESLSSSTPTPDQKHVQSSTFLFDMEIVSPLYLVAIKCRHPMVRRRAISLLRRTVRREGLWDSVKVAAIAERIMEIEEVELRVLNGSELPREEVRVANAHIESGPGLNPSGHRVTFSTMPEGVQGKVREWEEWLELRP
jgi:hypothetical protein